MNGRMIPRLWRMANAKDVPRNPWPRQDRGEGRRVKHAELREGVGTGRKGRVSGAAVVWRLAGDGQGHTALVPPHPRGDGGVEPAAPPAPLRQPVAGFRRELLRFACTLLLARVLFVPVLVHVPVHDLLFANLVHARDHPRVRERVALRCERVRPPGQLLVTATQRIGRRAEARQHHPATVHMRHVCIVEIPCPPAGQSLVREPGAERV